jgi:hypothetical protein
MSSRHEVVAMGTGGARRSWPPASAAHQRGDLRLRGQRHLRRDLLLHAAAVQGPDVQRQAQQPALLGLAAHHRLRRPHAAAGHHPGQGVRGAEWPIDLAIAVVWLGSSAELLRDAAASRAAHVRGVVVLHRHDRHGDDAARLQQPGIPVALVTSCARRDAGSSRDAEQLLVYAGVQDAFMQWWYGHNAVAFFLTTPFLG